MLEYSKKSTSFASLFFMLFKIQQKAGLLFDTTKKPEPSVILCSDFYYAACLPNVLLFSGGAKTELAPDDELSLFILLLLKPWSVLYIIS